MVYICISFFQLAKIVDMAVSLVSTIPILSPALVVTAVVGQLVATV